MDCKTAQQKVMPYIERKLNDRELEDFIEHIRGCKACSEELEVYFTIYYALGHLDNDSQDSFDMGELLEKDLKRAEKRVHNHHIMQFYRRLLAVLMGILAGVFVITACQTIYYGSFERTTLYDLFSNETPMETVPATKDTEKVSEQEETEQETNRKKQVIVKTPETEARLTEIEGEAM